MTTYRKDGDSSWQLMPETDGLTETVTDLKENTVYEFTVVAKYEEGEQWGPQSDRAKVKTFRTEAPTLPTVAGVCLAKLAVC